MLQTGIGFIRLSVGHKKCSVFIRTPGFASGDRTFRAKRAVPAECDTVTACNVVYQDFIYHSIRMLAWFLPEAAHFSETNFENLSEVDSLLIMWRNFWVYTFSVF